MTRKGMKYSRINLNKFCKAKKFEACGTKVNTKLIKIVVQKSGPVFLFIRGDYKVYIILHSHF